MQSIQLPILSITKKICISEVEYNTVGGYILIQTVERN
jgi:hypothetical protein